MRRDLALLIVLGAVTFFAGLGGPAIGDSDEAFYAEAGREMLESGDWLTPHFNYEHRFQKPILFYWLTAIAYRVAGVDAAPARFFAALAGLGLVLLTWICGRRWYDAGTGRLAGAIVATCFGAVFMARQALPDLPLAFFVALATWAGFERLRQGAAPGGRFWTPLAAVAAALAFLTKGPIGVVLPALVLLPLAVWPGLPRRTAAAWPFGWRELVLAGLLFATLTAPWYIAMTRAHGTEYLEHFFIGENVERFATDRYNEPRSVAFYVPIVLGGMLPWSPFMLLWLAPGAGFRQRWRVLTADEVRLIVWAAMPLVFFSLSIGKQPRYILPILPPLAILLAASLRARLGRQTAVSGRDPLVTTAAVLAGCVLVVFGGLVQGLRPLTEVVNPGATAPVAAILLVAGGALIGTAVWRPQRLPLALTVAAAAGLLALQYGVFSTARPAAVERLAAMIRARQAEEAVATYGTFVRNLVFYTHRKQVNLLTDAHVAEFLRSPDRVLLLVAADDLARIARKHAVEPYVIGRADYVNTATLKLRTVLRPDPARDLDTVLLVSNAPVVRAAGEP